MNRTYARILFVLFLLLVGFGIKSCYNLLDHIRQDTIQENAERKELYGG
jgi:hypothetical protein